MKNWSRLLVALIVIVLFSCSNRSLRKNEVAVTLRVMTYNIHHANPPSKPDLIDMEAIARVIREARPDLVALQEIDVYNSRSGKTMHEANELARLTGMKAFFAKGIDYGGGEYGVAILSRFTMEDMQRIALPTDESTRGEHRTLGTAVITLGDGRKIVFGVTHLDAQREPVNRLLQIRKISEHLANEKRPVIIAGDFNAVAGTEVINILDSNFTRTCVTNCGFTIPQVNPNKAIDFIAFRPQPAFRVLSHKVIQESYASDHLPVVAELSLTGTR